MDRPYLSGKVEVWCLLDAMCDLIIGNVQGVRPANNPDPSWQKAFAVTTRNQATKEGQHTSFKVASTSESVIVDRAKLIQMQSEDKRLKKYWDQKDTLVKGQKESCP